MYLRYILLLIVHNKKYEISAVDCTQIKDLDNLCIRPTIDYLQINNLSYAKFTSFKMTYKGEQLFNSLTLKANKLIMMSI